MRMRFHPGLSCLPGFEETIDDDRVTFRGGVATAPGGFAVHDIRTGINRQAGRVRKNHFAAVGDFFWIDRAMSGAKSYAIPARVLAGPFAVPVNGNSCKHGLFARKNLARQNNNNDETEGKS